MENGDPGAIVIFSTPDEIHQLLGLGAVVNITGVLVVVSTAISFCTFNTEQASQTLMLTHCAGLW